MWCQRGESSPRAICGKQVKQKEAVRCGQIFLTQEPGKGFFFIKEWVRGRAEQIHPKTGSKGSAQQLHTCRRMGKFKMGAGHKQRVLAKSKR